MRHAFKSLVRSDYIIKKLKILLNQEYWIEITAIKLYMA